MDEADNEADGENVEHLDTLRLRPSSPRRRSRMMNVFFSGTDNPRNSFLPVTNSHSDATPPPPPPPPEVNYG